VLSALNHREPDRVPVDLGGSIMTGIAALALIPLRRRLGLEERPPKVYELFQMLGEVETDLVERLGLDVLPVEPEALFFGIRRTRYKPWTLFDGTKALVPGAFDPEVDAKGNWLLHENGDRSKPVCAKMPKNGFYFDKVESQASSSSLPQPSLIEMEKKYRTPLRSGWVDFLAARASSLRPTGKALFLGAWLDFGPPAVGNTADWLCLMIENPAYVGRLFEIKAAADIQRLEQLHKALGDTVDVFGVDGADYGTQRSELFNPELFERFHFPYYRAVNAWVHSHTPWKTWDVEAFMRLNRPPHVVSGRERTGLLEPGAMQRARHGSASSQAGLWRADYLLGRRRGYPAHAALRHSGRGIQRSARAHPHLRPGRRVRLQPGP
jgi:hypothetical protein